MPPKKLTGWLILLMVWIGVIGLSGGVRSLGTVEQVYKPYIATYPGVQMAILLYQVLMGLGIAAWVYTAWILYRREPGTLGNARKSFLWGALCRIASGFSIPLLGGWPPDTFRQLVAGEIPLTIFALCFSGAWYLYLVRSQTVREIYAG